MGSLQENPDGTGNKRLVELNYQMQDEHQEVRSSVAGEGQGLSQESESRIHEAGEEINGSGWEDIVVPDQDGLLKHQQLPQGPVVRWERFLPLGSLKVLLVESDDSTRQVLSALLRNCSYEVTAVANGLQAWKILEDLTSHIDLILSEVDMPFLSGIGLLCKIMNHNPCKNIPVIMMSSYDSMGIVFKCLSKGAVDFLVKPIRKNELRNLWQHVWRRCHSSSGSGSGSGMQTQKSANTRSGEESDDIDSNNEDDNGSIGLNARDGSDSGSGTQSSWTKQAIETDKPPVSLWDQAADPHGSTSVQVIHPNTKIFYNEWMPMSSTRECQEQKKQQDIFAMGKDLEIGVLPNPDIRLESYPSEKISTSLTSTKQDKLLKKDPMEDCEQPNEGQAELKFNYPISELKTQAGDLIGTNINGTNALMEAGAVEAPNSLPKILEINDKPISNAKEFPSLELSLKRLRSVGDGGVTSEDDRNIFRRSDSSAFTTYHTAAASQAPTGYGRRCSLPLYNNSSEVAKAEYPSGSNITPLNQGSNYSSNNNDRGSTTRNIFINPAAFKDKSPSTSMAKCLHPSTLLPVQNYDTCPPQQVMPEKVDIVAMNSGIGQPNESHRKVQVQHHHHHHLHSTQQQQQHSPPDHIYSSLKNMIAAAPQCVSSNALSGTMEGNAEKYSLIRSGSDSNHGSNGPNCSSIAANAGLMNMESDNGVAGNGGTSGGIGSASGVDQNRCAQREAALTKFRQKRKQRCFKKKVRYQSRKRLAEQRPRMRGQFVRRTAYEQSSWAADF